MNILSKNKKASFDYFLTDDLEVGLSLTGAEVKSIIHGSIQLTGSYVKITNGEVFLIGSTIDKPQSLPNFSSYSDFNASRDRKLLLHKKEIAKFAKKTQERGTTLIMKNIYVGEKGKLKGTLCLGTGKNTRDKREVIKKRDLDRKGLDL